MANEEGSQPRAFISYSWSSQEHRERIRAWADRLMADGVEVVLDLYDLQEGDDRYAFMERMATDESVSHVLIFSDSEYARKADKRSAGVGVESQIISKQVYEKVTQSKFIPIFCELDDNGDPFLPTYMQNRYGIDFSSEERANASWEQLVRRLHGRPQYAKPPLGGRPAYLDEDAEGDSGVARARLKSLEAALLAGHRDVSVWRRDFLEACIRQADELRIREGIGEESLGERIVDDCRKLVPVRDALVDWVMLEVDSGISAEELRPTLTELLERLLELKSRPEGVTHWSDSWFGAHEVFVYEAFLYIVAALIRGRGDDLLRSIFEAHYMLLTTETYSEERFCRFDRFRGYSSVLKNYLLAPDGRRYVVPEAELIKRQATRGDIDFDAVMEAEVLAVMVSLATDCPLWYPGLIGYAKSFSHVPGLFLRATRHSDFVSLGRMVGIDDVAVLQSAVVEGIESNFKGQGGSFDFHLPGGLRGTLLRMMNLERLDTLP